MSFSMGPILIHSADLPLEVREALQTAYSAEPAEQPELLAQAAKIMFNATDLECADVKELIGLGGPPT